MSEELDIPKFLKEHNRRQAEQSRSTGERLADQIVPKAENAAYDLGDAIDATRQFFKNCGKFWNGLNRKGKWAVSAAALLVIGGTGAAVKSERDDFQINYDKAMAYQRDDGGWKYHDEGSAVKIIFNGGEPEYLRSDAFYSAQKDYRNAKQQVQRANKILDPK